MTAVEFDERRVTAYHELGHGVVGAVLGNDVVVVHIVETMWSGRIDGYCESPDPSRSDSPETLLQRLIETAAAGAAAERRVLREDGLSATEIDRILVGSAPHDDEQLRYWLRRIGADEHAVRAEADALVAQHWPRITELVPMLLRDG